MRVINFNVSEAGCLEGPVFIGYQGENEVTRINVDYSDWIEEFGPGALTLEVMRSGDTAPYIAPLSNEDGSRYWLVSNVDTGARGIGAAGFVYAVDNKIKKSAVFRFFVAPDIGGTPGERPDPYEGLIAHIEKLLAQTEENAAAAAESAQIASSEAVKAEASRQAVEDLNVTVHEDPDGPSVEKLIDPETGAVTLNFGFISGGVSSVNGKTGRVSLDLDDIPDGEQYARTTPSQVQQIGVNEDDIDAIEELIPNQATPQNQLADKAFVNSSINSSTAFFRGAFPTRAALFAVVWQTSDPSAANYVSNNDYAYVADDETQDDEAWRYIYVLQPGGINNGWQPQFRVNESPLTAAQLAALNSGATADLIAQITANATKNTTQDAAINGKQPKITVNGILKGNGKGGISAAVAGEDYLPTSAMGAYRTAAAQDTIDNAQNTEISKNAAALDTMRPAATSTDIGKALIIKAVENGKPSAYEYGEAGGGGGSALTAGDGIDISNDVISNTQGIEYIVGTQASSTAAWTGNSKDEALKVGKIIAYYLPFAGTSLRDATLTLTMADGTQTAAIPLRRAGTSTVTNQFAAGNVIILIYDGTYWRVSAYYDANDNTVPTGYCLSPTATAGKMATCSYGYRGDTNYFPCLFRYANTADDATLAIITYAPEAAPIYVNGERTSATNTFGAGVILFLYYNGAYYCYNDGRFPILVDGAVTSVQEYAAGLSNSKQAKITASGILKGDGEGGVSAATDGTDYLAPSALGPYRTAADQDEIDSEQDERIEDLEQATTATTIGPAPIVTFDASAADMPLKGLTVDIEPVQDLHGYDNPWPGGGGKNLLDGSRTYQSTNTIVRLGADDDSYSLQFPAGQYTFSCSFLNDVHYGLFMQYEGGSNIALITSSSTADTVTFTLENTPFRMWFYGSGGASIDNVTNIQLEQGARTAYEPYSNICPITGWTGCNIINGIDLDSITWTANKAISADGTIQDSNGIRYSSLIRVQQGKWRLSYKHLSNSRNTRIHGYDQNGSWIEQIAVLYTNVAGDYHIDFDVADNIDYIAISTGMATSIEIMALGMPYTITFPTSAGTVYSGTLDVANKKLTVDRLKVVLDGTQSIQTFGWRNSETSIGVAFKRSVVDSPICPSNKVLDGMISDCLVTSSYSTMYNKTVDNAVGVYNGTGYSLFIRVAHPELTTQELFNSWMAENPITVICPIVEPVSYQLTVEEITTLLGTNSIWADCGDVTVTYGAYLETVKKHAEVVGDSILSAIAPLETSYTASQPYTVGSFLFVGTKFYKVTATIAEGGTITPGTNVTQTTVAEQLMALANA